MFPIINNSGNCRDCYRCLRNCDVKAISFRTGQAKIMTDQWSLHQRMSTIYKKHYRPNSETRAIFEKRSRHFESASYFCQSF